MSDTPAIRPEPAASGTLGRTPLVHLLLYALDKALAGTIEFSVPDGRTAAVLFDRGRPAKARTSEPIAYLGRSLVELGFLSESQLARSLTDLAAGKRDGSALHGRILLAAHLIDERQLEAGLREQLLRKLIYVASFPSETTYAYYAGFDGMQDWGLDAPASGSDPVAMMWRLLRDSPPRGAIDAALEHVAASTLRLSRSADLARLALPKEYHAAAELLGIRPIRSSELPTVSGLREAEAQLLIYVLLITKQVDVLRVTPSGAISPPTPPVGVVPKSAISPPTPPVGVVPKSAISPPTPPVVVVPKSAISPPTPPVGVVPKSAISPPTPPASSADGASPRAPLVAPTPLAWRAPRPSSPGIVPPPPPPPDLAPPLAARWKEIVDRSLTIDRADYFSMLDLARDATRDEVESTFIELAKQWHPDRLPPELAPVRDACSRVFARVSEARSTLTDDEQRERYMHLLADGSGSPEMQETVAKVVEAATNFQKAEVCMKRNDLVQAEAFARKAVEADATQPDYVALLAWLIALKPENQSPEKTRESIQMLDRAVSLSARCEKAYFWRGLLYKRVGKAELAMRDFKRVVDLNPRNIDAAREVRLYRMRGGKPSDNPAGRPASDAPKTTEEGKSRLFGRLFKKS